MSASQTADDRMDPLFPSRKGDEPVDPDTITEEEKKELEESENLDVNVSFRTVPSLHEINEEQKRRKQADVGPKFMPAEHTYLGDTIKLRLEDGTVKDADQVRFSFYDRQLQLTHGQINCLGGGFYGTHKPICQGGDLQDRINRFIAAYNTLAQKSPFQPNRQPKEAKGILSLLQQEVDGVNRAIEKGNDPSIVYSKLPNKWPALDALTWNRPKDQPTLHKLAALNLDYFGADAQTAYDAGHTAALQLAQKGDLLGAYKLNAFADHFLEDRFAAGHMRTPRRMLFGDTAKNLCAKYMHDEDNAIGLSVQNPCGNKWNAFGDKRLADAVDKENLKYCREAVQLSANEIYDCWKSKKMPSTHGVWQIVPTLASAASTAQECCPLFVWRPNEKS